MFLTKTDAETEKVGKKLALQLKPKDVIALHGDLGAGKTTLVKGIVQALTSINKREISSPTFTYLHIYEAKEFSIFHFDLYRLKNAEGFLEMGGVDYLDGSGICLIEWPDRITSLLPQTTRHLFLSHHEEGKRRIDVG